MTLNGFFLRFALLYIGLLFASAVVLSLLEVQTSSINVPILLATVMGCCHWFGKKNQRFFTPAEQRRAIWGMIAINTVLQLGFLLLFMPQGMAARENLQASGIVLLVTAVVLVVHALVIWFFTWMAGKQFAKHPPKGVKPATAGDPPDA